MYVDAPRPGRIYLPGSFNPLHDGHQEMLQASAPPALLLTGGLRVSPGIHSARWLC